MSGRSDVACSHLRADGAVTCCDLAGNALTVTGLLVGCGDDTCRICDPDDQPEAARWLGGGWWHARCLDAQFPAEEAARRQARRRAPLGVVDAPLTCLLSRPGLT